jgi:hypothetical protein
MPLGKRTRLGTASPALDLPPAFRLLTLREVGDAFAHAMRVAAQEGAGTLVHVGRFDVAEFAVVLEPQEPLRTARRALYAGLVALGDTLVALAPPQVPLTYVWPDAISVDGVLVGGGRLGWPQSADEDAPPEWLVFAAMIRTATKEGEPGLNPLSSTIGEEGVSDLDGARLVESFSRHLMVALDAWQERGFDAIARPYLARLAKDARMQRTLAENGDLLVRHSGSKAKRLSLLRALEQPSWLDPASGDPRA